VVLLIIISRLLPQSARAEGSGKGEG